MPVFRSLVLVLAATTLGGASTLAQSNHIGPSVLAPQTSYHLGTYGLEIDVPSGALRLVAQQGTANSFSNLAMTTTVGAYEFTATTASFVPNVADSSTYFIGPEGEMELDLDPANPGTDLIDLFVDADARTFHRARHELDTLAESVLVIERSTGMSASSLTGDYHFYTQHMELVGPAVEVYSEWGTMTFDGIGLVSFTGTEMSIGSGGTVTTSAISGSESYTVINDGTITFGGDTGGMTADGQMFFVIWADVSSKEVGIAVGVKVGSSYDHHDLVGRYSVHSQTHGIDVPSALANSTTEYGIVTLDATSATTGTWSLDGLSVQNSASNVALSQLSINGTSSLTNDGVLTMIDPGGVVELAVSADGRYFVGRVLEPRTSLLFGMRQAEESRAYGIATPGTGGIIPELGMRTFPTIGNTNWRFAITDGLGGAPAGLPIGFRPTNGIPLIGGLLWIDPAWVIGTPFLILGGTTGAPGAGSIDFPFAIPNDPGLTGLELYAQAIVLDPAAPGGVAMSNGFEMRMGP